MKSRFDVLTSHSDRRSLAYFRSSGAVAILLALLVMSALQLPSYRWESVPADLLVLEIGAAQPLRSNELAIASLPQQVADRTSSTHRAPTPDDEFAFGPYYSVEPIGY